MGNIKNTALVFMLFLCPLIYAQSTHRVQAGDTLYNLGKKYNVGIDQIIRLNPQITKESIKLGDVIWLPNSKMSIHQVQPKETIYGLSKRFEISQEALFRENPQIKEGLKVGDLLRIPSPDGGKMSSVTIPDQEVLNKKSPSLPEPSNQKLTNYLVKEGDTLFTIMRIYKLGFSKILEYNSELKSSGLKSGMTLKIPVSDNNKDINSEKSATKELALKEALNVVILLPLYQSNTSEKNQDLRRYAADFYAGAKYAIDLFSSKQPINVKLFDTENNKSKVENFLNEYDFSQVQLAIGPFFRSGVEQVAQKLSEQKIPLISPVVSSESLDAYSNVIQAEVRDEFLADPIIEEIKNSLSKVEKIYLLSTPYEEVTVTYVRDQLLKWNPKLQISTVNDLSAVSIDADPFLAILVSEKPDMGKAFIENIRRFKPGQVFPLGLGYNPAYYDNLSWLRNYGMVFTMKYHVNKNTENDRNTLDALGIDDKKIPDKYKLLGFDVTYDILERLTENKNLLDSIDNKPRNRLANKFQYEKNYQGGYINKGVWTVRFKSSPKIFENKTLK